MGNEQMVECCYNRIETNYEENKKGVNKTNDGNGMAVKQQTPKKKVVTPNDQVSATVIIMCPISQQFDELPFKRTPLMLFKESVD